MSRPRPSRLARPRRTVLLVAGTIALLAAGAAPAWAGPSAVSYRALPAVPGGGIGTPVTIATGQLDGAGRDDVVVLVRSGAGGTTTRLLAYTSGPTGTLSLTGTSVSVGRVPASLAVADFDGDGDLDAAVGTADGHVVRWIGDGTGGFTIGTTTPIPPAVGGSADSTVTDLAAANLNGDATPDVVATYARNVALGSDGYAALVTSGGGWTVGTRSAILSNPVAVAAGDMDGDGIDDLIAADDGLITDGVSIAPSNGAGGLGAPVDYDITPLQDPTDVSVGDLDADGALDLVATTTGLLGLVDTVTTRLGKGDGTLLPRDVQYLVGQDPQWVSATAPLTDSGFADPLVLDTSNVELTATLSNGFGGYRPTADFDVDGVVPVTGAAGDLDGDGWEDAVALLTDGRLSAMLHRTPVATVAAPPAFASQAATTLSAPVPVTVTNTGADANAPLLHVNGATIAGTNPGDFTVGMGTCAGSALALGQSCALQVRFAPTAVGARTATLATQTNGPLPATPVALSGTGADLPSGPAGPQGVPGTDGTDGTNGAPGPQGAPGTDGTPGATGPTGATGPAGAQGATGKTGPKGAGGGDGGVTAGMPCPQQRIRGTYYLRCSVRFAAPKGSQRWVRVRIYSGSRQSGQRLAKISSGTTLSVPVGARRLSRGSHKVLVVVRDPRTNLAVTYANFVTVR